MIKNPKEMVKIWRSQCLPDLELMHATYITHQFPKHAHDGFAIGIVESGELGFYYRGANIVAGKGMVNLANSGEVHNGKAMTDEGWTYRMFYFQNTLLTQVASQIADKSQASLPYFPEGVLQHPQLAAQLWQLHTALEMQTIEVLQAEIDFLNILGLLIHQHADYRKEKQTDGFTSSKIKLVCDLIRDQYDQDMSLEALSQDGSFKPIPFFASFP